MVMARTAGSISTDSTILPLTSGKRRKLVRRLRQCVRLWAAMSRLSSEGGLWSGPRRCSLTDVARVFVIVASLQTAYDLLIALDYLAPDARASARKSASGAKHPLSDYCCRFAPNRLRFPTASDFCS